MQARRPSSTAQSIALARAHLTWLGLLDDPYAGGMLNPWWARIDRVLRHRPLTRFGSNRLSATVCARTRFFDRAVVAALDAGVRQVVVVGAGYDSRAWRLSRPGVLFFEVDHPATQADKRLRAPAGGPCYVAADLAVDRLADALPAAGFAVGEPAVFLAEGLTQYLTEQDTTALLRTLAGLGGPSSRLAVNFGLSLVGRPSPRSRVFASVFRASVAARHETFRYLPTPDEAATLLAVTGWTVLDLVDGAESERRYLTGTGLPVGLLSSRSCLVTAEITASSGVERR